MRVREAISLAYAVSLAALLAYAAATYRPPSWVIDFENPVSVLENPLSYFFVVYRDVESVGFFRVVRVKLLRSYHDPLLVDVEVVVEAACSGGVAPILRLRKPVYPGQVLELEFQVEEGCEAALLGVRSVEGRELLSLKVALRS